MATNKDRYFPSPWDEFLTEFDGMLNAPLELHCIGGFVLTHYYKLPRTTGDIDYYTAIPSNLNLDAMAGDGSDLHKKYRIWLHRVTVTDLPEDYENRLADMAEGEFNQLRLRVPDPYDCILSKIDRGSQKDRNDSEYLFRKQNLDVQILRERYDREFRPNYVGRKDRLDTTLRLWIEIFAPPLSQH